MAIAIVCVILICTVLIQCFYVGNGKDKYGNRLDGIENYQITDERQSSIKDKLVENTKVKTSSITITGRIIYIDISFETNVELVEAETIASELLNDFSDEEKSYYDFNITLKQDATSTSDGFLISGAHNKNGTGLIWNNNRQVTTDSSTTTEG